MKIILDVANSVVDCTPDIANLLSILKCQNWADEWLCTNFIQLVYRRDEKNSFGIFLDLMRTGNDVYIYEQCPYLYVNLIDKCFVEERFSDVFEFVYYCLERGFYIQMYTNKHYLPQKNAPEFDFMHETFIYGIDTEERYIYISDFYDGKYKRVKCDYSSFEKAYLNSFKDNPYYQSDIYFEYPHMVKYHMDKIILIKYEKHNLYENNCNIIKEKIEDYISGRDSFKRMEESYLAVGYKYYYGIDFYDQMLTDIENNKLDIRKPYVLYCHKVLLRDHLFIMNKCKFVKDIEQKLLPLIEELIIISEKLYKKYLKLILKKNVYHEEIECLCKEYRELRIKDISFMTSLLDNIEAR